MIYKLHLLSNKRHARSAAFIAWKKIWNILPPMAGAFREILEDLLTAYDQAHRCATIIDIGEYQVQPGMAGNGEV